MNTSTVGFVSNIETDTLTNTNYRNVLYTGKHMQLVVMSLLPGQEIGMEVHETHDQFFRIEAGQAKIVMNGEENMLNPDEVAIVPAGAQHNVINTADVELKLYTIYAPSEHPAGTVQAVKPV